MQDVDMLKSQNKWDQAIAMLKDARTSMRPFLPQIEEKLNHLLRLREEAFSLYQHMVEEAKGLKAQGRVVAAVKRLCLARRYFPDQGDVDLLLKEIKEGLLGEMVRVPGSECILGPDGRKVKIPTFYIDRYEVTNAQYAVFVLLSGYRAPPHWQDGKMPKGLQRYPVVRVSFEDACRFAEWAGKRLPTEEEWEKAARYVDGRIYPWGNNFPKDVNKIPCNSLEYNRGVLLPVGSFPGGQSPYGVYDMAGNVWEWTSTKVSDAEGEFRILKGGCFMTPERAARSYNRLKESPGLKLPYVGFRCVKD
jgi:formylglycine-generating enzyme required for sulfatase activity